MPTPNYRYYCHDREGRLHNADWFFAADDEAAIAHVEALHPGATCEVWEGKRLVASISAARLTA